MCITPRFRTPPLRVEHPRWRVGRLFALLATVAAAAGAALPATGAAEAQEPDPAPARYDVDQEFVQGIVRDVAEGGRLLLVELRADHEMIRGTDPTLSDPSISRDPDSSALRAGDRRDGRLRRLDLGWATGWAFVDDLEGGDPEVVALEDMYGRFRVGQIVEIGARYDDGTTAAVVDTVGGSGRGGRPDPRDLRAGATAYQGRVDTIRFEGPVQVRVNRAFE